MFSQLGPLFKTVFRSAEHADTRLEIRREEKEDGRKKRETVSEDENSNELWEDKTSVSVSALRSFLIEFLQHKNVAESEEPAPDLQPTTPAPPVQNAAPISSVASRAVKAYSSMNAHAPTPSSLPQPSTPPAAETASDDDLAGLLEVDEVRAIHRLIADLDTLTRAGIETLSFEMDGKFIDSVSAAVKRELSRL